MVFKLEEMLKLKKTPTLSYSTVHCNLVMHGPMRPLAAGSDKNVETAAVAAMKDRSGAWRRP